MSDRLSTTRYSIKAAIYARYRWDYAPQAIESIVETAHLSPESRVADIGSGTGILTRHFVSRAARVYAVEPNAEMRQRAVATLASQPAFVSISGCAEDTTLPDGSIDLITVAQALHWFEPHAARREFQRILRPGGWLAVMWNRSTHRQLNEALGELFTEDKGWDTTPGTNRTPSQALPFFFGADNIRLSFGMAAAEPWEHFFGALCSDSHAPDEDHPLYHRFERAARHVFDQFQRQGVVAVHFTTELCLGPIRS